MTPALSLSQRPVRKEDVEAFNRYVEMLSTNDRSVTFVDCVRKFIQEKQEEEDLDAIKEGIADIEAGRYSTLDEVDQRIRAKLNDTDAIEDGIRQADAGLCRPFEEVDARIRAKYGWDANP